MGERLTFGSQWDETLFWNTIFLRIRRKSTEPTYALDL